MSDLYKSNVKGKIYKLLFAMRENMKISHDSRMSIKGGKYWDWSCSMHFGRYYLLRSKHWWQDKGWISWWRKEREIKNITYKGIMIHPPLFQDNVLNATSSLDSAKFGNKRMEKIAKSYYHLISIWMNSTIILIWDKKKKLCKS